MYSFDRSLLETPASPSGVPQSQRCLRRLSESDVQSTPTSSNSPIDLDRMNLTLRQSVNIPGTIIIGMN